MTGSLVVRHFSMWSFIIWFWIVWIVEGAIFLMIFNRKSRWIKRARRLARESNIELPSRLESRIAKRLRNEVFASFALYPLFACPMWLFSILTGLEGATYWTTWFPWLALMLPMLLVCYSFGSVVVALEQPRHETGVTPSTNKCSRGVHTRRALHAGRWSGGDRCRDYVGSIAGARGNALVVF